MGFAELSAESTSIGEQARSVNALNRDEAHLADFESGAN
jgi:hypothetical protein